MMNRMLGVHEAAGDERNKCSPPRESLPDIVHPQCRTCFAELLAQVSRRVLRVAIDGPRHRYQCKKTRSDTVVKRVLAYEMPDRHSHTAEQLGAPQAAISIPRGPCLRCN